MTLQQRIQEAQGQIMDAVDDTMSMHPDERRNFAPYLDHLESKLADLLAQQRRRELAKDIASACSIALFCAAVIVFAGVL